MSLTETAPVTIDIDLEGHYAVGRASLRGHTQTYDVTAQAVRHEDGSIDGWATDLVTARLLRRLEIALMETIHERIDRTVLDE